MDEACNAEQLRHVSRRGSHAQSHITATDVGQALNFSSFTTFVAIVDAIITDAAISDAIYRGSKPGRPRLAEPELSDKSGVCSTDAPVHIRGFVRHWLIGLVGEVKWVRVCGGI